MSTCTTQNIEQTVYLGCSVVSFNCQGGMNEQPSEVNVTVVKDDCAGGQRVYYNTNLDRVVTTDADPGFIGEVVPIVGCPTYFRFGDFEFNGIIQSWEKEDSSEAKDIYSIKIVTPIKILQNTSLIIADYSGPISTNNIFFSEAPNNLINVYGFAESIGGVSAPLVSQVGQGLYDFGDLGIDGAVFGTSAGGFGGAGVNSNGMQWSLIKNIFSVLTSAVPAITNTWSPHGRLTHKGVNLAAYGSPWTNGYGIIPYDSIINNRTVSEYFVDLTEVPQVPSYFRFSGVSVNLLEAISRVMQEVGYDYYIEFLTVKSPIASNSGIAKILKVRTISRLTQPSFGQIQEYIDNLTAQGEKVIGSSVGREFRDDVTSTFIIGGPKQTVYQAYQSLDPDFDGQPANPEDDDMILPYFGKYDNGNMIVPYLVTGWAYGNNSEIGYFWEFEADTTAINLSLQEMQLANPLVINEKELLFSTSIETWENYIKTHQTHSYLSIANELPESELDTDKVLNLMDALYENENISNRDMVSWDMAYKDISNQTVRRRIEDKEKIYQFITSFVTEYYGKKFAVRVPYTAVIQDSESLQKTFSEQPTNDGGWTEVDYVLGLPNGTYYTDFFSDEQGKIGTILAFSGANNFDLSLFSVDDYITYNNYLYLKGSVDEEYVFHNITGYQVPRVVVTAPNVVWEAEDSNQTMYSRIHAARKNIEQINPKPANIDEKIELFANVYNGVAAAHVFKEYGRLIYIPDSVAIPMRSNVNNYGPWLSVGPAGGIRVEQNEGLVPWEYGGYEVLNIAAQALADAGVSNTQVIEMGSVTIEGYPNLPLGAEINSASALQNKHLIENRTPSFGIFNGSFVGGAPFTYQYLNFNYGFNWNGSYGPNITNISLQGDANITTTYNMRSYTPRFGQFAELNASRLRQVGQNRMQLNRDIRRREYKSRQIGRSVGIGGDSNQILNSVKGQAGAIRKALEGKTPHEILVGELTSWQSGSRAIIATESIREAIGEMNSGAYERKAFMSLDGLIRPVSLNGRGGLPRFINATGSGVTTNTNQIYIATTGFEVTGLSTGTSSTLITVRDLNPLSNPAGYAWSELAGKHLGTKGHDIDIVGRGTGVPSGGMILRHLSGGSGFDYRDDYSFFAFRGPMVMQAWGYDTEGKPVPNEVDTQAESGIFKTSGLTDRFLPDWLQKSKTWPVAPIDFRLDRGRGVWTLSNSEPTLYCRLLGHLAQGSPTPALILDSGTYYYESGASGQVTGYSVISGWTETSNLWASGCDIKFRYDTRLGRWEAASQSIIPVLLTSTVTGGTWDRNVTGIKPSMFTAPTFGLWQNPDPSGRSSGILMYRTGVMVTGWNRYTEQFDVSPGSAYIGKLVNGWLEGAECASVEL